MQVLLGRLHISLFDVNEVLLFKVYLQSQTRLEPCGVHDIRSILSNYNRMTSILVVFEATLSTTCPTSGKWSSCDHTRTSSCFSLALEESVSLLRLSVGNQWKTSKLGGKGKFCSPCFVSALILVSVAA